MASASIETSSDGARHVWRCQKKIDEADDSRGCGLGDAGVRASHNRRCPASSRARSPHDCWLRGTDEKHSVFQRAAALLLERL